MSQETLPLNYSANVKKTKKKNRVVKKEKHTGRQKKTSKHQD